MDPDQLTSVTQTVLDLHRFSHAVSKPSMIRD